MDTNASRVFLVSPRPTYSRKLQISQRSSLVNFPQVNDVRQETAWMQREILGSWKQYSGREFRGFFPVDSNNFQCFPAGSVRKSSEKKSGKFPTGILLPCSKYFPSFPAGSGDFPGRSCEIRCEERFTWVTSNYSPIRSGKLCIHVYLS